MRDTVLIVAPFCSLPGEPYFNRFLYLAELLSSNYEVTLVTSRFRHFDKNFRGDVDNIDVGFRVVLIDEPGYSKNVSVKRLYSHFVFCRNFKSWFDRQKYFDVIYSAYPLIETNKYLIKRKKQGLKSKIIVDIQDVWPESISSAFPYLKCFPKKLMPFSRKADYVYSNADALVAVSETYLKRALTVSNTLNYKFVYIGSDFNIIKNAPVKSFDNDLVKLFYLGTLSFSYDIETVIKSVNTLVAEGYPIEFHVFGGGPIENSLKKIAGDSIFFHGYLEYEEMISYAKGCDIAVNPIKKMAAQSVTNKLSDYLSLGKPIISSQNCEEVKKLLSSVDSEFYRSGSIDSFSSSVKKMLSSISNNMRSKPNPLFNRELSYKEIVSLVDRVLNE